jgi:hypothetical protein
MVVDCPLAESLLLGTEITEEAVNFWHFRARRFAGAHISWRRAHAMHQTVRSHNRQMVFSHSAVLDEKRRAAGTDQKGIDGLKT